MDDITKDIIKISVQLVLIGVVGGGVSYFYSLSQKTRELRINTIQQLATLHGRFIALRYEYNSFHVRWHNHDSTTKRLLPDQEIDKEKWICYTRSCQLVGEFQSLSPIVSVLFPGHESQLEILYNVYQEWRRQSGANTPILQAITGESADQFTQLRVHYGSLITSLKKQI